MLLFYLDEPLSDEEAVQIAEALADAGEHPEVVQKRISFLYPVGEAAAASSSTELLSACPARTGLGDSEVCALSIPRDDSWRADVLADAFYRVTNRNPYMIHRWLRATSHLPAHRIPPALGQRGFEPFAVPHLARTA